MSAQFKLQTHGAGTRNNAPLFVVYLEQTCGIPSHIPPPLSCLLLCSGPLACLALCILLGKKGCSQTGEHGTLFRVYLFCLISLSTKLANLGLNVCSPETRNV